MEPFTSQIGSASTSTRIQYSPAVGVVPDSSARARQAFSTPSVEVCSSITATPASSPFLQTHIYGRSPLSGGASPREGYNHNQRSGDPRLVVDDEPPSERREGGRGKPRAKAGRSRSSSPGTHARRRSLWSVLPDPALSRLRAPLEDAQVRRRLIWAITVSFALFLLVMRSDWVSTGLENTYLAASTPESAQLSGGESQARGGRGWFSSAIPVAPAGNRRAKASRARKAQGGKGGTGGGSNSDGLYRFDVHEMLRVGSRAKEKEHPVAMMIREGQKAWAAKNARQSKTLRQAVDEYRRRYAREPPKGFEKWWAYVREHQVQLPDEYDQIDRDIRLFQAHAPARLRHLHHQAAAMSESYVVVNSGGVLSSRQNFDTKHPAGAMRLSAQLDFLKPVAKWIGDFEAVWSVHDTGRVYTSWSSRKEMDEAVRSSKILSEEQDDGEQYGWSELCPSSTDFWRYPRPGPDEKSFISDHLASLNIAAHPAHLALHGITAGPHRSPKLTGHLPLFSLSRTSLHSDILGIPFSHLINRAPVPWNKKSNERLLWRGGITGGHYDHKVEWKQTQRFRLIDLARSSNDTLILPPSLDADGSEAIKTTLDAAGRRYLDVGFTGAPLQCDKSDGTCDAISKQYDFVPHMSHEKAAEYKYVLDVDGNAWSARFKGLLSTGSVVFKSTVVPEWYHDRVQPWVHYVPIKLDYSDMLDAMAYFTGDMQHQNAHDSAAREVATAGQEWTRTHWRQEDMVAYTFRLYLEWARVYAEDREAMAYKYSESDEYTS